MRTFTLLAILTVISGTFFTASAAPLVLAVDAGATIDASVKRDLAANHVSGVRKTLESLHGRGDTLSSAKRDSTREAIVGARSISVFALTKRFGNLIHGSALADTTIGKRQPRPITNINVQARAQAQVDAAANVDLLLKRDPARAGLGALFGGLRRDLATTQKRRYVSDDC